MGRAGSGTQSRAIAREGRIARKIVSSRQRVRNLRMESESERAALVDRPLVDE